MNEPAVGIEFILPNERKVFPKVSIIEIINSGFQANSLHQNLKARE